MVLRQLRRSTETDRKPPVASEHAVLDDDHRHIWPWRRVRPSRVEVKAPRVPQEPKGRGEMVIERDLVPEIPGALFINESFQTADIPGVHHREHRPDSSSDQALREDGCILKHKSRLCRRRDARSSHGQHKKESEHQANSRPGHGESPPKWAPRADRNIKVPSRARLRKRGSGRGIGTFARDVSVWTVAATTGSDSRHTLCQHQ